MSKQGKVKQVKPEMDIIKGNGRTEIRVSGDAKNAIKLFEKRKKEFLEKGYKKNSVTQKENNSFQPPISVKVSLESSPELILLLNKIAIEFYAFNNMPIDEISELREKVGKLDETIDNVFYCNFNEEIREFENEEISHLITIQNNPETKILYAYIELFNVVCAVIPLVFDYDGENVNISYKQNAIDGTNTNTKIILKVDIIEVLKQDSQDLDLRFGVLINKLSIRLREKDFSKLFKDELSKIKESLSEKVSAGKISEDEFVDEYVKRSTQMVAEISLFDFPYMIEDFKDEENDEVNYIHSNLKETDFNIFCEKNSFLIGKEINLDSEGVFVFDSFFKQPFMERNGINLITVFCVLAEKETGRKRYIPYRIFFEGLKIEEKKS